MNRKVAYLFFLFCLGTLRLFPQSKSIGEIDERISLLRERDGLEDQIEKARNDSSLSNLSHSSKDLRLFLIKEGGKIVKLVEWYFFEDYLIYTETNWWDPIQNKLLFSEKTYHEKGRLIAWIKSESSFADSNSEEFRRLDKELQKYAAKLLKGEEE